MPVVPPDYRKRTIAIHGERGRAWLERLPSLVETLSERWQLTVGPPFKNLTHNYVAPARDAQGRPCVLKIGVGSPEGDRERLVMQAYDGRGAARIYRDDAELCAMLLERISPAEDLRSLPEPEAQDVVIETLRTLWAAAPPKGLPGLRSWTDSLERRLHEPGPLPIEMLRSAAGLRRELLERPPSPALLHGDLHHTNLLRSRERGWLAIDPKGVVGERAYDVVVFLLNPGPVPIETTRLRIEKFADGLGLDPVSIKAWALVQAVVSACWTVEDEGEGWEDAIRFAECVKALPP